MTVDRLPFVQTSLAGSGHSFWSVTSSGNEFTDAKLGREYAMAYLEFEATNKDGSILSTIFHHMQHVEQGTIERHFLFTIASALETALENPWFIDALRYRKVC